MFARKKTQDFQTSITRFTDLGREPTSRAKHFRLAFEALNSQERKQLIEDFAFELFHLIDALLISHYEAPIDPQTLQDTESALWTLEQVLCSAPEMVGRGWQRSGIEFVLRMALHPNNVLAVRKLAIRLFFIWYQELALFGHTSRVLDTVFQCCLPHFPLRDGQSPERILLAYCGGTLDERGRNGGNRQDNGDSDNNGFLHLAFDPGPVRAVPVVMAEAAEQPVSVQSLSQSVQSCSSTSTYAPKQISVRERAQTLQIYLDKFLEYTTRESVKVDWTESTQRLDCAKFVLDRVIVLYIYEVFPEAEANGVDVYGGWEGTCEEEGAPMLDTADPLIIARYWLIRWISNIASESKFSSSNVGQQLQQQARTTPSPGLLLFKQALFSSQKATNVLLTLIREAFRLPLACINVIQKVLELLRHWLLQREFPPFVESGLVSMEAWAILLIHMLFSFFRSPYLASTGDRLPSAISITHSILQIVRDLANPSSTLLARPLSKLVWQELVIELSATVELVTSKADAFGQATAGGFTRTLLSVFVFVRVIREVDMEERMWDDAWAVFRTGVWEQMVEQWARVVDSMTRALVLNLFAIDLGHHQQRLVVESIGEESSGGTALALTDTNSSSGSYRQQPQSRLGLADRASDSSSAGQLLSDGVILAAEDEDSHSAEGGAPGGGGEVQGVVQSTGNVTVWLRAWMRVVSLVDPSGDARHSQLAVQTLGRAIDTLIRVGCANTLVHWLCAHLLRLNIAEQPHAIPILFSVLSAAQPPPLERAYILHHLMECLRSDDVAPLALEHIPAMEGLEDMAVISADTIATLQKLVRNQEFSSRAIKVATLLSLNHPEAEKLLLSLLEQHQFQIDHCSLAMCINALSLLILERADAPLFDHLLRLVLSQQNGALGLSLFCTNLNSVVKFGFHSQLAHALLQSQSTVKNPRTLNELKWQMCAAFARESIGVHWPLLSAKFDASSDDFFLGFCTRLAGQYPLPGFPVSQWNSQPEQQNASSVQEEPPSAYMETEGAILSIDADKNLWSRTFVGRHCYNSDPICIGEEQCAPVDEWLASLGTSPESAFQAAASSVRRKKSSSAMSNAIDPFQELPRPTIRSASNPQLLQQQRAEFPLFDISVPEMMQFVRGSVRDPDKFEAASSTHMLAEQKCLVSKKDNGGWRRFVSSFGLLDKTRALPPNFHREIRHLDTTLCREVHKVAVIYVARDQHDKQCILANNCGSEAFDRFVDGLGWMVQIGSPQFHGYTGGLPNGHTMPYFCSANTELIFHVSTLLNGDNTQRLKHLGNDEVHVVWSENPSKPYRRDLIATRFCDVLIVLYLVSPVLLRVHTEVQDQRLQFGPLFDGACVHILQAASLIRETVLNASRAYRNLRVECDRPNKHREKVFREKKQMLKHLPLSTSIIQLYAPATT